MSRVLLDANVLLEILFERRLAGKCQRLLRDPSREYAISAITVHIIWYMAERYKFPASSVDDLLSTWIILPVTEPIIDTARGRYDGKDFEDCLQAACAEAGLCKEIITIDKHFKAHSHSRLAVGLVA
jgi:predicted nucleic acid-binding protein